VRNDGTQPLSIGAISLPEGFSLTRALATTLAPLTSDRFSVRLNTAAVGTRTGQISFTTNDADENPFNFAISGTVLASQAPEVTVLDGFSNIADGSLGPVDFGTAVQAGTAPTRTFTVRNDGNATLTLGIVTVPDGFTLVEGLGTSLAPRATETFTVRLETTTIGVAAGEISLATNDSDENPFNFPVTGSVLAAAPEIRVFREDFVELSDAGLPASVFATSSQGQPGSTLTFMVFNDGTTTLRLNGLTLPDGFTFVGGLLPSLGPGENSTFSVRLDTTTTGVKAGDIVLDNGDADENPFEIPITGTVVESVPEITVLQGNMDVLDGGPTPLPFGDGVLRDPGPRQTFTVRNDGTSALTLGAITLPSGFTLLEGLVKSLAPGVSDTFTVRLDAANVGTFSGEITISNNDADENPFNFTITSTVTATPVPEITVLDGGVAITNGAATAIDFGSPIRRQKGPTRTFTIRNDGSDTLRIGRIELPTGFTLVKGSRRNLAPRGTDTIVIRLDTKVLGTKTGMIRINTNDSDEDPFSFAVTGMVLA
jgi:hypothetical protein